MTAAAAPAGRSGFENPAEVVERALSLSRADGCMVMVEEGSEVDVRFACNTTTTNGRRRQRRVVVISIHEHSGGTSVGIASRGGAPDLEELVRAAESDAAANPPAEDAAALIDPTVSPSDHSFAEAARLTELSVLQPVLSGLADHLERARQAGHVLAGFAQHRLDTTYLGTSSGVRRRHEQPTGCLELVARADGGARSSWVGVGSPWFEDVDVHSLHDRLERRLAWAERRVDLPAGRYDTVLPPDCTADLMVCLAWAMSGRDALDGRSAFSAPGGKTKIGQRLARRPFSLWTDPAYPGMECAPFLATSASSADVSVFDNGMPLGHTSWVEEGTLRQLAFHRAGGAHAGHPPAALGDNLILQLPGASGSVDDLVADVERGLLLTCFWYIREVDPATLLQTGLTRDGVYLVEHGEVTGAVNNFRFNESPLTILDRAVAVGTTERSFGREWSEWMNRTAMPPVRVGDFNMSTVSPAT